MQLHQVFSHSKIKLLFSYVLESLHFKLIFSALTVKRVKGNSDLTKKNDLFCNHSSDFDDFPIPVSNNNDFKVTLMESHLIKRDQPLLNKNYYFIILELRN